MADNSTLTPRMTDWDVKWNGNDLGTQLQVDPDIKLTLEPITRGTTGKIILGHFIVGLEGSIKTQCADVTLLLMKNVCPWFSTGSVPLTPGTLNVDLYSYAELLTLHPHDMGSDVTQDINLIKAVPMQPANMKRDGTKQDEYDVEFNFYPDRSKLVLSPPQLVYGFIGAVPS